MARPSRELTAMGTITFPDATTHALTPTEISKFTITENAGDHLPLGGVSASTLTLILDNRLGEWEPGGSILGSKSLDGAIVNLEIGVHNPDYIPPPDPIDGGKPETIFTESIDGGEPGETFAESIDGGEPGSYPMQFLYSNVGSFVIEKPLSQEQDAIITLKGSDYLANRALKAFSDTLTYPKTVLRILQQACLLANITLKTTTFVNSTVSIPEKPVWDENTTCRDVISYVACLAGGFARIDRNGELEIISFANQASGLYDQLLQTSFDVVDGELIWTTPEGYDGIDFTLVGAELFTDTDAVVRLRDGQIEFIGTFDGTNYYVHPNRYKKLTNQGVVFGPFNALSVYEFGAPNGYGATRIADDIDIVDNELNSIAVRGNPLLAYGGTALTTLIMNMLASLGGLEYYAASIDWQGDPSITCGDMLTISNLKSEAYTILVLNQTLTFDNGFSMVTVNRLNTNVIGKAKVENLRVFTPTGKLNAAALEGDINIRAGRQLNLLSDGALIVKSGAGLNIESGGKINIASADGIVLSSGSGLDSALGGKLGTNDPAAGVQTSKITIDSDSIDIASGGDINIASGADITISAGGNFNLAAGTGKSGIGMSNDRSDDAFIWAGSDTPANAPFRVTMDGELTASSIGGSLVIPVANGGTGYNRQTIHRGTDYPSTGFGQDGDLFIFHNGQADSSWSAQTLTYGTGGQNTYFGVNRNWNQVPTAGFYRFGNGVGSSTYDFGAYAYFTAPAAVNSLTFTFVTAKYYNSTWYGYSGTTTYKVALVKANNMSVILASTTCYASQSQNTQTVTLTTAANMVQGDTYYIAVSLDGSDEKTNAGIVGSVEMQGKVSNSRTFDLLLKSGGEWHALLGNG
jgi:hypothetical protein